METKGDTTFESVHEQVEEGSSSLLLAPSMRSEADEACLELLSPSGVADQNVLWVTFTRAPDACMQDWLAKAGRKPENLHFISVGESTRSAAQSSVAGESNREIIETLSNPSDLTGLGIKISEILKAWGSSENRTVSCFHSLTALLQYADVQTVYKFLHVLTGRFKTANVTSHFHLDPEAHDAQTVNTLKSLFDSVIELEGDEWVVRTR